MLPTGPDIAQFKQGVKTVAGKMAVLANGVMNTIQVNGPDITYYTTYLIKYVSFINLSFVSGSLWLLLTELR